MASIEIPLKANPGEVLEIMFDELPGDESEIISILKEEEAHLDLWFRFAIEYYKRGNFDSFREILLASQSPDLRHVYYKQRTEKIKILNSLAAYFINLAVNEKDQQTKIRYLESATSRYNEAEGIDFQEPITLIGKGVHLLTTGNYERAKQSFDTALDRLPNNVPALMGKACICYHNKEYKEALALYQKALGFFTISPHIRLGIGLCFHKLGDLEKAQTAYKRVLDLDNENIEAMVGLAIIDLNSSTYEGMNSGLQLLKQSYKINISNPTVLNQLANHFFFREDYAKSQYLATQAIQNSEVDAVKSESYYYLGRCSQIQEDFESAFQNYSKSCQLNPDQMLGQFGLGQMYLYKGDKIEARKCFEKILSKEPNNFEILKILGTLLSHEKSKEDQETASKYLKRIIDAFPDDFEAWMEYGELQEKIDLDQALKCYETAHKIWKTQINESIPLELLNNLACIYSRKGQHEMAASYLEKALNACEPNSDLTFDDEEYQKLHSVSIRYNLARVWEDLHLDEQAMSAYKDILSEYPDYLDCYMRIGLHHILKGEHTEGMSWLQKVLDIEAHNPNAWSLMGLAFLRKNELKPAQEKFDHVLEHSHSYTNMNGTSNDDPYALVSLANVQHKIAAATESKSAPTPDPKNPRGVKTSADYTKKSLELYHKALTLDPKNIYAANGIGVILSEKGHFLHAKNIFVKVREATNEFPDVWTNLAHIYTETGQHLHAIKLYEGCLKKFFENKDVPLLIYIARACYLLGKETKDHESFLKSRNYLERALLLRPFDHSIRFNIALVQQECALIILKKTIGERTVKQVEMAQDLIQSALKIFSYLKQTVPYPKNSYDVKMASERANYCEKTLIASAQKHLDEQKRSDKGKEEIFLNFETQRLKLEEEELAKQEELRRKKREEEEEIEAQRRKINEKVFQTMENARTEIEEASKAKKKKKNEDSDTDSNEEAPKSKKEKKPKREKSKGEESTKKKKKRKKTRSGDEGGEGEKSQEESEGESRKKNLESFRKKRNKGKEESEKKEGKVSKLKKKKVERGMDDFIIDSDEEMNEDKEKDRKDDNEEDEGENRHGSDSEKEESDKDEAEDSKEKQKEKVLSDEEDEEEKNEKMKLSDESEGESTQKPKKRKFIEEDEDEE